MIDTRRGPIIVTGCAHPGIVNIVRQARSIIDRPAYIVMGGFHLHSAGAGRINRIIAELQESGVKRCGPCHCSGDRARKLFRQAFGDEYIIDAGVGTRVKLQRPFAGLGEQ